MHVVLKSTIQHTTNLFGSLQDIASSTMRVIEESTAKDSYMCINQAGGYLVDVDKRDIEREIGGLEDHNPFSNPFTMMMNFFDTHEH